MSLTVDHIPKSRAPPFTLRFDPDLWVNPDGKSGSFSSMALPRNKTLYLPVLYASGYSFSMIVRAIKPELSGHSSSMTTNRAVKSGFRASSSCRVLILKRMESSPCGCMLRVVAFCRFLYKPGSAALPVLSDQFRK